ncbi:MAG: hypothetical protein AAB113_06310, partial [Candidatus Eisenbacteria bacterium]
MREVPDSVPLAPLRAAGETPSGDGSVAAPRPDSDRVPDVVAPAGFADAAAADGSGSAPGRSGDGAR